MKRVIIFDFDGVLADSLAPMLSYAKQVCHEMGVDKTPTQSDLEALDRMEFSAFGHQLGIPGNQIEVFVTRNHQLFSEREEPMQIKTGMGAVVSALAEDNTLAIITGNSCKQVEKFLDAYQLREKFHTILCAEHEGNRLEKINKVQSMAGSQTTEYYMIGDAVSDIRAARTAGIKSIAVSWGHQSKEKLSQEAPDLIVDVPEDLLRYLLGDQGI